MRWLKILCLFPLLFTTPLLAKEKAVVHAVFFYSPKCPHCHAVMDEDLAPLTRKYGDRLQVTMVNIDTSEGQEVFKNAMRKYSIPKSRRVVPFLIIGPTTLVGSEEIKRRLSFLVDKGLSAGGRKLPKIQGLEEDT